MKSHHASERESEQMSEQTHKQEVIQHSMYVERMVEELPQMRHADRRQASARRWKWMATEDGRMEDRRVVRMSCAGQGYFRGKVASESAGKCARRHHGGLRAGAHGSPKKFAARAPRCAVPLCRGPNTSYIVRLAAYISQSSQSISQ